MYLCLECYNELGKPKHYDFNKADYFAPNIVTDSFGDEPYEDHSMHCKKFNKSCNSYYNLEGNGYGIKIDFLEEFEKLINENNVALVRFGCIYTSLDQKDYGYILFIHLEREYAKNIYIKEGVSQVCLILYLKGKKRVFYEDDPYLKDILHLCDESSFRCEKEAIQSKHHKHDLYKIEKKTEIDCSICKGLIEFDERSYICLDCPFILCQVCRDEVEGKKIIRNIFLSL